MKIECRCGAMISDSTDSLPHKAHVIPDQDWFDLLDAIDYAVEKSGPTARAKEAACFRVRDLIGKISRMAWQCRNCGNLHVDDQEYELRQFLPTTDEIPRELFRSKRHKDG